jgi:hypothetical protein
MQVDKKDTDQFQARPFHIDNPSRNIPPQA